MDFAQLDRFILAWVAPWAVARSSRCAYYQHDGSLHVSKSYVYSIPIAIENNESFPPGFCIARSESIELYSTFFDFMMKLAAREADIFGNPLFGSPTFSTFRKEPSRERHGRITCLPPSKSPRCVSSSSQPMILSASQSRRAVDH
jgi:hypothetical protein